MPVGKRRSELDIIRDILRTGHGKTITLRYNSNLSHTQMEKYVSFLEKQGLLELEKKGQRGTLFYITEQGREILGDIDRLYERLGLNDLEG